MGVFKNLFESLAGLFGFFLPLLSLWGQGSSFAAALAAHRDGFCASQRLIPEDLLLTQEADLFGHLKERARIEFPMLFISLVCKPLEMVAN